MKRLIILSLAILSSVFSIAQTNIPQLVSFSAVVRDANNQPLANTPVSIRLSFKQGGPSGTIVYCALHQDSTNSNGFISIQLNRDVLGTGCNGAPSTAFENIPWQNGGFWMEVEYQTLPSSPFVSLGQLELASSFYAFAAGTAERLTSFNMNGIQNGDVMTYNSTTQMFEPVQSGITNVVWANIQDKPTFATVATSGSYNDLTQKPILSISNDTIYLSGGSFVKLPATSTGTMLAPNTTNQAASNIQSFSATLNGTVNANGLSSTVVFEWGLTTAYENGNYGAIQSPVTGTSVVAVSANLTDLQSNTTYHYRIKATNAVDITYSNDMSFTTPLSAPQLTTNSITSITGISAISGGNITFDGGSAVTARGVCWSTNPAPTLSNSFSSNGTGSGSYTSNITTLALGTTYYVCAYATNTVGTTYGNVLSFTTVALPTVTTAAFTDIKGNSAKAGGAVTNNGGSTISAQGLCWSTSSTPTIANSVTTSFTDIMTVLSPNTTYYVRAYATNIAGTGYGNQISFNSGRLIGTTYGGGLVFYNDGNSHGLVCADADQSTGAKWGCDGTAIGGTSTAINTGAANTNAIVAGCTTAGIAAKLCYD